MHSPRIRHSGRYNYRFHANVGTIVVTIVCEEVYRVSLKGFCVFHSSATVAHILTHTPSVRDGLLGRKWNVGANKSNGKNVRKKRQSESVNDDFRKL